MPCQYRTLFTRLTEVKQFNEGYHPAGVIGHHPWCYGEVRVYTFANLVTDRERGGTEIQYSSRSSMPSILILTHPTSRIA